MMDNLNLKPQSPDEVKTMMWTGENQREMFDLLTCGKKIDDYMTASGENFFIDHKWQRVLSWQNMVWTATISCEVRYDNGGSL